MLSTLNHFTGSAQPLDFPYHMTATRESRPSSTPRRPQNQIIYAPQFSLSRFDVFRIEKKSFLQSVCSLLRFLLELEVLLSSSNKETIQESVRKTAPRCGLWKWIRKKCKTTHLTYLQQLERREREVEWREFSSADGWRAWKYLWYFYIFLPQANRRNRPSRGRRLLHSKYYSAYIW